MSYDLPEATREIKTKELVAKEACTKGETMAVDKGKGREDGAGACLDSTAMLTLRKSVCAFNLSAEFCP